ncbi:hypothetical protein [Sulfuracidifex metallicus]|uniref:Uncharacterized protein n=1 Tax=Sulfuracidifex metallicus DSM 6482 = JCM 9184 TaxID=523847 RepID=A0A6A9QY92_SULME|nr:hypothetical protein [Sulfuracidifex metallicus]MUN29982.1 hypothetical protein [Sulfuracidifex metallicus DSM 6482 = JCM 9184]WOE51636.1 hypothetical protein RQ359_000956 [Sulfuracidifex metallicus DSM 6482 = JCM 9184]
MTDALSLALSTGLGPVLGIIIMVAIAGIAYKMAGTFASVVVMIALDFALTFLDFLPIFWGLTIFFGLIAGLIYFRGERNGD